MAESSEPARAGVAAAAAAVGVPLASCWSCAGPAAAEDPACGTCGAPQPPGQADHFARLGLARGFAVDRAALDQAYFERQRALHPDRFRSRSPREQALAQAQAAALNDAYQALRSPTRRAGHLLALAGRPDPIAEERTVRDPELLEQAMADREALEEAGGEGDLAALAEAAAARAAAAERETAAAFAAGDLDRAERATLRLKYLDKLAAELRVKRARLAAA